jgi:hypothetical protein
MKTPAEIVAEERAKIRTQKVFETLVSRAPNGLRLPHLRRLLPSLTEEQILTSLNVLVECGRVEIKQAPNRFVPGRVITSYTLVDPTAYPIRETITIGGVEFPRAMHGDLAVAEDLNAFTEAIAEYDAKVETRIAELASSMTRRYWGNLATLFALFVGVFALILRATDPIAIEPSVDPWTVAGIYAARLIPLAAVLFMFVLGTWVVIRKM